MLPRVRNRTPQLIGIAPFNQQRQPRSIESEGKPQGDVGETPELPVALCIRQEDGQSPHDALPALSQIEWAGKGQLSGIACQTGFLVLRAVTQLIEANALLIACQWNHTANDALWSETQSTDTGVVGQHLRCNGHKVMYAAVVLPHQRRNRIGRGQCPLNAPLQRLRMVRSQIRSPGFVLFLFLLFGMGNPHKSRHKG